MEKNICKICNSQADLIAKDHISYMEGVFFDIYHCTVCDTNFIGNQDFDLNIYQYIYAQSKIIGGYSRYHHYAETILTKKDPWKYLSSREPMYWSVKKAIKDYNINKNSNILEIGSGLGYMTFALTSAGYKITGVDISQNAVDAATKKFGNYFIAADIFELCKQPNRKYDLIIMNEVIEHVPDPKAFIDCAVKMLAPGGKLIVTTPDKSVSIPGQAWDTDLPPVHLWWLSFKSMKYITDQLSCHIDAINFKEFSAFFFDKMRLKIYEPYQRAPSLSKTGEVLNPHVWKPEPRMKGIAQSIIAWFASLPIYSVLLTRKEFPIEKSNTLAVVIYK